MLSRLVFLISFWPLLLLAGCTAFESNPAIKMLHHVTPASDVVERTQFDPAFHYLRVVVDENVVFMASDTPNIHVQGTTTVWYSAGREVLRFRDGRLIAAVGLAAEWRGVVLPSLPRWSELAQRTQPYVWTRVRDVMPGYRYGVHDELVLQRISPPTNSRLRDIDSYSLTWFEERSQQSVLPVARYAVDLRDVQETVVYGEQCVSPKLCFSWQRWPTNAEEKK